MSREPGGSAAARRHARRIARCAVACGVVVGLGACREPPRETAAGPPDPLPAEEAARTLERGAAAADALAQGLVAELMRAIEERGYAGAVEFCSAEAIPITERIQAEQDAGAAVKRTSLRVRNPANAPDPWEERVLRYLEAMQLAEPDAVPAELAARGPDGSVRYYRTLRTAPFCLGCHGTQDAIDADVRDEIRARYPQDRATGYEAGEFRGVIRVELPAS